MRCDLSSVQQHVRVDHVHVEERCALQTRAQQHERRLNAPGTSHFAQTGRSLLSQNTFPQHLCMGVQRVLSGLAPGGAGRHFPSPSNPARIALERV